MWSDDGNGIVDDIHGYDFVNKTGKMADILAVELLIVKFSSQK